MVEQLKTLKKYLHSMFVNETLEIQNNWFAVKNGTGNKFDKPLLCFFCKISSTFMNFSSSPSTVNQFIQKSLIRQSKGQALNYTLLKDGECSN